LLSIIQIMDNFIFKKGAKAILLDKKGRVLMGKRAKGIESGKWCLVGGKPEENETMEEAVIREVREEISISVKLSFYREVEGVDETKGVKWLSSYFIGHLKSDNPPDKFEKNELSELRFFSFEELDDLEIAFDHKKVLKDFFKDYPLGVTTPIKNKKKGLK